MDLSLVDLRWNQVAAVLTEIRTAAGLSQRGLAAALDCPRSLVSRLEQGERRVDVLELFLVCQACGADPVKVAADLMRRIQRAK